MPDGEHDRAMKLQRGYQFRLDPTPQQEQDFRRFAGCRRFAWNWALARKRATYQETGTGIGYNQLAGELVALKQQPATAFLKECDSQVLQQTLRDLDRAFSSFFERRAAFPQPKTRKQTPHAFRLPQRVTVAGSAVRVPKVGRIKARLHLPMEGTVKSATVKQAADKTWFITFVSHSEQAEREPTAHHPAGIDVGLETFAAFDDGEKIAPPKFYCKQERKLNRLQRQVSRCRKGSRNRSKSRQRLAIGHAASAGSERTGCTNARWRS